MSKCGQADSLMTELLHCRDSLTDVATLNAMGLTLRRLDRDSESADCYEKAYNITDSEDMGIECFFSCLKGLLFRRCHQVFSFITHLNIWLFIPRFL